MAIVAKTFQEKKKNGRFELNYTKTYYKQTIPKHLKYSHYINVATTLIRNDEVSNNDYKIFKFFKRNWKSKFLKQNLKFLSWLKSMKALYISKESISVGSVSHSGPQPYTHPALPASP